MEDDHSGASSALRALASDLNGSLVIRQDAIEHTVASKFGSHSWAASSKPITRHRVIYHATNEGRLEAHPSESQIELLIDLIDCDSSLLLLRGDLRFGFLDLLLLELDLVCLTGRCRLLLHLEVA